MNETNTYDLRHSEDAWADWAAQCRARDAILDAAIKWRDADENDDLPEREALVAAVDWYRETL